MRSNVSILIDFLSPLVLHVDVFRILLYYLQWLKKQAEASRVADIADSDLTEEERNPLHMKDKAE